MCNEPLDEASGANGGREHKVEGHGLRQLIVGHGRLDAVLANDGVHLLGRHVVQLPAVALHLVALLAAALLVRHELLEARLDQVVGAEALAVPRVLHHEVGEAGHVAGRLQHARGRQHRAADLGEQKCL